MAPPIPVNGKKANSTTAKTSTYPKYWKSLKLNDCWLFRNFLSLILILQLSDLYTLDIEIKQEYLGRVKLKAWKKILYSTILVHWYTTGCYERLCHHCCVWAYCPVLSSGVCPWGSNSGKHSEGPTLFPILPAEKAHSCITKLELKRS